MLLVIVVDEWFSLTGLPIALTWWLVPLAGPAGVILAGLSLTQGRKAEYGRWRGAARLGLWLGIALMVTTAGLLVWFASALPF